MIVLDASVRERFPEQSVAAFCAIEGTSAKVIQNRHTRRVQRGDGSFYIKCHRGVGWREIIKNLLMLRRPVLDAGTEWRAIRRVRALGIDTLEPLGWGMQGFNPATRRSFLLTRDLGSATSLERLTHDWMTRPPSPRLKWKLVEQVARIARTLHENGVNHRDFYLCHLLLGGDAESPVLFLIDLHRAQLRRHTPSRWRVKDLGALYFSSMDIGLGQRDRLRFIRQYSGKPLRETLNSRAGFWRAVMKRARRMYAGYQRK